MIHSRDVRFNELICGVEKESSSDVLAENPPVVIDSIESSSSGDFSSSREEVEEHKADSERSSIEPELSTAPTVRRSQIETRRPDYYGRWVHIASTVNEPNTVDETLNCSEKENWEEAMKGEFQSLCKNQVWT